MKTFSGYDGKTIKYDHFHSDLVNESGELRLRYFRWLTVHQRPHFLLHQQESYFICIPICISSLSFSHLLKDALLSKSAAYTSLHYHLSFVSLLEIAAVWKKDWK